MGDAGGWALGFGIVVMLAFQGGGFDPIVAGEAGVAVWWLVVFGVAAGALTGRLSRAALVAAGLFLAFAAWTGLSATWSESAERSVSELARVSTYGAVLVFALLVAREVRAGAILDGIAAAVALIASLAFLSWLKPAWFPHDDLATAFADDPHRLSYPVNYWNGLAALLAIGLPCILRVWSTARLLAVRAAAGGVLPLLACAMFFTGSRGGVVAVAIAVTVWLIFVPNRLGQAALAAAVGLPSLLLMLAANSREDLTKGLDTAAARSQGDKLLLVAILVVVAAACLSAAAALVERHATPPEQSLRPRLAGVVPGVVTLALVGLAVAVPRVDDEWREFKAPPAQAQSSARDNVATRLGNAAGNGRYQYWQAARAEFSSKPIGGTGAGTFEFWWARHPGTTEYVRSAHNQYLQTLGETGLIGFLLFAGALFTPAVVGVRRRLRAGMAPEQATALAAAAAGFGALLVTLGYDWVWRIPVLPVAGLLLAAVLLQGREPSPLGARDSAPRSNRLRGRVALVAVALAGVAAVAVPLAADRDLRASQQAFRRDELGVALREARTAARVQPYAATPLLQQALILEAQGDFAAAAPKIAGATQREPTNWRVWLVRARIAAQAGDRDGADAAARQARLLNPNSDIPAR